MASIQEFNEALAVNATPVTKGHGRQQDLGTRDECVLKHVLDCKRILCQ